MQEFTVMQMYELDPSIGIYHKSRSGFYPLSADVMEMFRAPVIDLVVYRLISRKYIQKSDFNIDPKNGFFLTNEKFKLFLSAYRKRLFAHNLNWSRKITSFIKDLVSSIRVMKPVFEGVRWR